MNPRNSDGDVTDELLEELADAVFEDDESFQAEVEAMGGEDVLRARVESTRQSSLLAIGEARREMVLRRTRPRVQQQQGQYEDLSDDEVRTLWAARTEGLDATQAAVQFREFEDVTPADMRTLLEDLDRVEARGDGDDDE